MDELIIEYRKQNEGIINDLYLDELKLVFGIKFEQLPDKLKNEYFENKNKLDKVKNKFEKVSKKINKKITIIECDYSPIDYLTIIEVLEKNHKTINEDKRKEIFFFNVNDFEIDGITFTKDSDTNSFSRMNYNILIAEKQVKFVEITIE